MANSLQDQNSEFTPRYLFLPRKTVYEKCWTDFLFLDYLFVVQSKTKILYIVHFSISWQPILETIIRDSKPGS